tara:strand:- start:100 stop:948 length:849 start_codon:yes stop_codon:yes gene_type:complete
MHFNIIDEPWVESPFFYEILKKKKISIFFKKIATDMHVNGYCIFDLNISDKFIDGINKDIQLAINSGEIKKNPKIYHYNDNPRVVEAWKYSKKISQLANNSLILRVLNFLYDAKPLPFSTINFIGGTEQPFHSDYIHFGSMPERYLVGAWVALEATHKKNGPLAVIPKSHKLPLINYQLLKQKTPTTIKELEKSYRIYEEYIENLIKFKKLKQKKLYLKKGQAILWSANLIHGGTKMIEKKSTRKSQVTHYHFDNSDFYYNPGFSDPKKGLYIKRKLDIVKS